MLIVIFYCYHVFFSFRKCVNDVKELKDLFVNSKLARCRSRFVLPVILFENKVLRITTSACYNDLCVYIVITRICSLLLGNPSLRGLNLLT